MKLFDLHCDTPHRLYKTKEKLFENDLHISLSKAGCFERYIQCSAVWSDSAKSDTECFEDFLKTTDYFEKEAGGFICNRDSLKKCRQGFILTVEDSRLISDDIDRAELLYKRGVRAMTLVWGGRSAVGGSWNTDGPLTPLGKDILERCFELGIIPDISHSNDEISCYALQRAEKRKKPVIATHSDSRALCPIKRNISDDFSRSVAECGGIIGISLYPPHLCGNTAEISDIIHHIRHLIDVAGANAVCLGCDLDGIGATPKKIDSIADLPRLYDALSKAIGAEGTDRVFFNNAYNFFTNNLP